MIIPITIRPHSVPRTEFVSWQKAANQLGFPPPDTKCEPPLFVVRYFYLVQPDRCVLGMRRAGLAKWVRHLPGVWKVHGSNPTPIDFSKMNNVVVHSQLASEIQPLKLPQGFNFFILLGTPLAWLCLCERRVRLRVGSFFLVIWSDDQWKLMNVKLMDTE